MKPSALLLALAVLCGIGAPAAADQHVDVGRAAPAFRIQGLGGQSISLDQFHGRPVFVNFFATWCPPCKLELPFIVQEYPHYKNDVEFLGIDEQEAPDAVKAFVQHAGMSYTIGIDEGNVAAAYLVSAIPVSIFIDKQGIVRAVNRGYLTPQTLRQDLRLIAGH